jgi:hypothetical protein
LFSLYAFREHARSFYIDNKRAIDSLLREQGVWQ